MTTTISITTNVINMTTLVADNPESDSWLYYPKHLLPWRNLVFNSNNSHWKICGIPSLKIASSKYY